MATRALIHVYEEPRGQETTPIVTIYKHWDGYPESLGRILGERLTDARITNGLGMDPPPSVFNGVPCLAAAIVAHLKKEPGDVYLQRPGTNDIWEEYVYHINPYPEDAEGRGKVRIEIEEVGLGGPHRLFAGTGEMLLEWLKSRGVK